MVWLSKGYQKKATILSRTLAKGFRPKRVESVRFRLVLLSNSAMITVNTLDTVAKDTRSNK